VFVNVRYGERCGPLAGGQALFIRSAVAMLPVFLLAWRYGGIQALRLHNFREQILGAGLAVGAFVCLIFGLRYLPFVETIIILHASPLFVVAMAPILLRERVGWRRRSAVAAGFLGVVLVAQPSGGDISWYHLLPLSAAMISATRDILVRQLVASETTVSIIMITNIVAFVCTLPFAVYTWSPLNGEQLWLLVTTGLVYGAGIILMTDAYRHADASLVSGFRFSGTLWAFLFGIVIWGYSPGAVKLVGASLIVGSGIFVLYRKPRRE
jgi:drug/metabolite transporter (DMT)-like permease